MFSVTDRGPGIPDDVWTRCSIGSRPIRLVHVTADGLGLSWSAPFVELQVAR
jgi:hypothetical protein